jgi:hypothetical protein
MSVHRVEVTSHGPEHLQKILGLILTSPSQKFANVQIPPHESTFSAWRVKDGVLFFGTSYGSSAKDEWTKFPCSMTGAMVVPIITAWLGDQKYPPQPPFDGDSVKGYLIKTRVGYEGDFSVEPAWVHYGK